MLVAAISVISIFELNILILHDIIIYYMLLIINIIFSEQNVSPTASIGDGSDTTSTSDGSATTARNVSTTSNTTTAGNVSTTSNTTRDESTTSTVQDVLGLFNSRISDSGNSATSSAHNSTQHVRTTESVLSLGSIRTEAEINTETEEEGAAASSVLSETSFNKTVFNTSSPKEQTTTQHSLSYYNLFSGDDPSKQLSEKRHLRQQTVQKTVDSQALALKLAQEKEERRKQKAVDKPSPASNKSPPPWR